MDSLRLVRKIQARDFHPIHLDLIPRVYKTLQTTLDMAGLDSDVSAGENAHLLMYKDCQQPVYALS